MTSKSPYFSFREFIVLSWRYKWFVIGLTGVFAVLAVWIALSIPNQYKSEVTLTPSEEQQGGGLAALANQFGSLASLAGINLQGKGTDKTLLALEMFRSRQFLMSFIDRHDLLVPLLAAKEWDQATDTLVINPEIYDEAAKKWVRVVSPPKQQIPTLFEAYEAFRELIVVNRDQKTGIVKISLTYYSPKLARDWLSLLVADLNDYIRKQDLAESDRSVEYLQQQINQTEVAELKNVFFQLIQEQIKTAMLAKAREEYVFKTVDAALVPERKSKPIRSIMVLVITFIGGLFSIFLVHVRQAFLREKLA